MNAEIAIAYQRLNTLGTNAMRLLPNLAIALLVFLLFLLAATVVRKLVQRFNAKKYHHNLVLVLGRMTQWGIGMLGLLLAITIAFPSFTPANLVSLLHRH